MTKDDHSFDRQIGNRVRMTRQFCEYSIPQIAEFLAISKHDLEKKECGLRQFLVTEILLLSKILRVRPSFFFKSPKSNDEFFADIRCRAKVFSLADYRATKTAARRQLKTMRKMFDE